MTNEEIETLGIKVSQECKWGGDTICKVFMEALSDANFHTLRETLEPVIKKYLEE